MENGMTTALSILGAGLIALLGFVLQGIRSELRSGLAAVRTELTGVKDDLTSVKSDVADVKSDVANLKSDVADLKSDVATVKDDMAVVKESLVRIETTQIEHGRRLDRMANQGERIATLEGALAVSAS